MKKYWIIDLYVDGQLLGTGGAFEKRQAEQLAAHEALQRIESAE
jgi:dsRNA-specific ribonuclease